ncbi:g4132 [Coccomyxa viridis]|uniref:G4132 protein n=1 Tax=Coccomyxa viridis TaxID=1274662 RepID=A0ABP1FPJ3_9CHLO
MQRTVSRLRSFRSQWPCILQQSRAASSQGGLSALWSTLFGDKKPEAPSAAEKEVQVLRDELRTVKQQLDDGTRQLRFQHKRLAQLTDQLGYLTETTLRKLAAERYGQLAVEHKHIFSIHSLASLLLTPDVLARAHELELLARERALAEALAAPACFTAFLRTFCARLKSQYGRDGRLGTKISQVEQFCAEVGQHLLVRPHTARNRAVGAAVTALQQLEGAIQKAAARMEESSRGPISLEDSIGSEGDDEDGADEEMPHIGLGIPPPAKPPPDPYQPHWTQRYFNGIYKYLRAAKEGREKLHSHLVQPDSLGIALLAVASSGQLCTQFELDGQGALDITSDSAVVTVFEFKSSMAGMAKGKQQLKARLEMLLWALTHSNALSPQASRFLRGKGYLYFPKSSSIKTREIVLESGRTSIHVGTL